MKRKQLIEDASRKWAELVTALEITFKWEGDIEDNINEVHLACLEKIDKLKLFSKGEDDDMVNCPFCRKRPEIKLAQGDDDKGYYIIRCCAGLVKNNSLIEAKKTWNQLWANQLKNKS